MQRAIDRLRDLVYLIDEEQQFRYWNEAVPAVTGYSDEEIARMDPTDFFSGGEVDRIVRAIEEAYRGGEAVAEAELVTRDGDHIPYEFKGVRLTDDDGELIGLCGVGRDISERVHRSDLLTALHEATRSLMAAETPTDICDVAIEIADDILDHSIAAVYLRDEATGSLYPEARTPDVDEVIGDPPPFAGGESLAWDAFVAGESRRYDDVTAEPSVYNPETPLRSELMVPLGDHGVFIAGSTEAGALDDQDMEFAETLAANTEAALDRADREQALREHDRHLEEQNEALEHLDRINSILRDVARTLIDATTRETVERTVCELLVEDDLISFAWIGREDHRTGTLTARAVAGAEQGFLEEVVVGVESANGEGSTVDLRVSTGDIRVIDDLFDGRTSDPWRRQALDRGFRSMATIPLTYRSSVHGVLQVYSGRAGSFDGDSRELLRELGNMIGYGITAINRRDALLADSMVELDLRVPEPDDAFADLAVTLDATVVINSVQPVGDCHRVLATVREAALESVDGLLDSTPGLHDVRLIGERPAGTVIACDIDGRMMPTAVAEHGGAPREISGTKDGIELTVELPRTLDVRSFIETLSQRYPGLSIVAQRDRDRSPGAPSLQERVTARLTDRQQEALEAAYFGGLFEWPRDTTGEAIAEALDLSAPTFHQHLRAGERKLLEAVLDST